MTSRTVSSSLSYFFTLCIFSIALFILDVNRMLAPVHAISDVLTEKPKSIFYAFKRNFDQGVVTVSYMRNSAVKIAHLEQRVAELTVDSERLIALERENTALKDQIGITNPAMYTLIPAETIGFDRYLLINKGDRHGVKKGMVVISRDILIGLVEKTTPFSASVLLLTDPDSKIPVKTSATKAKGLLMGRFGNAIIIDKVIQQDELKADDTVVTSGEEGILKGLVVGEITKIFKKENELFQYAEIKPLIHIPSIENVFVINPL